MHILIITGIFPPDIGGPATYVPELSMGLVERGHDVEVITLAESRWKGGGERYEFKVVRLPRDSPKLWRFVRVVGKIARLGREADILLVNGLALEAAVANQILRKPLVQKVVSDFAWERATARRWVTDDFEEFQQKDYGFKVQILKALRAWWTRSADAIIVPSRYMARWVKGWGVEASKVRVVYNAVELLDGSVGERRGREGDGWRVVTVCRLVPWKHVDEVIAAVAGMTGTALTVIGNGPERHRLEGLVDDLGVRGRVRFLGSQSRRQTLESMRACDVFVLNSTYEGLPHVVLEAMALGLPVVATAVGGTPEIVRDHENGRLIRPGEEGALRRVLLDVLTREGEGRRLGEAALSTAASFTTDRLLEETTTLLNELLGTRERRRSESRS